MDQIFALCALGAAPAAAIIGAVVGRWSSAHAAIISAGITGAGWAAAVTLAVISASSSLSAAGSPIDAVGVSSDWMSLIMLMLVLGLSSVIQLFAVRYLRADRRQTWFIVTANLVTGSTALMVTATTVLIFALGWLAAGASLVALLATYSHLPQARAGVRRTAIRFALGDLALGAAIVSLLLHNGGDVAFADLPTTNASIPVPMATIVALLLVIPALARSSQVPFHGWLPVTLAAPTPVSALMHAGVVNAGAILIIRFSPTVGASPLAMTLIFAAGTTTLLYASAVRLTKPDAKGRLVFSTMAQMGFMMLACGMGAFAAAVFHLVAHGLYKATMFLGAGSGVSQDARQRSWPARAARTWPHLLASTAVAVAVAVGSILLARGLLHIDLSPSSQGLQVFVIFTAAVAFGSALNTHFSPVTVGFGGLAIAALSIGYTAMIGVFDGALSFASASAPVNPWWLLAPGAGLVTLQVLMRVGFDTGVSRRLYAFSLAGGSTRAGASVRRTEPIGALS